jgi:L-malate glycosyltransferase
VTITSIGGEKRAGDLAALRAAAVAHGLEGRLRFLGRRPDARRFIASCDVYVNPSDAEGLPLAVLEALASGRPVVATAVGGVPSVVRDGETGVLVGAGDAASFAAGIESLLDDPARAAELGRKGQELVLSEYGLEAMVRAVEAVYAEVLGG